MPTGLQPLLPGKVRCSEESAVPGRDREQKVQLGMENGGNLRSRPLTSLGGRQALIWGYLSLYLTFPTLRTHFADPRPAPLLNTFPEVPWTSSLHLPGVGPIVVTFGMPLDLPKTQFSHYPKGNDHIPWGCHECR